LRRSTRTRRACARRGEATSHQSALYKGKSIRFVFPFTLSVTRFNTNTCIIRNVSSVIHLYKSSSFSLQVFVPKPCSKALTIERAGCGEEAAREHRSHRRPSERGLTYTSNETPPPKDFAGLLFGVARKGATRLLEFESCWRNPCTSQGLCLSSSRAQGEVSDGQETLVLVRHCSLFYPGHSIGGQRAGGRHHGTSYC